jgi:hypothetical protein
VKTGDFGPIQANDSDADGMSDFDELKAGRDPLLPGALSLCLPSYGCGARIAAAPPPDDSATLLAVLLVTSALISAGRWRSK